MSTMSVMRAARLLRSETLDDFADAVKAVKSHLSVIERHERRVGTKLRRRIEQHFYGASWATLSRQIDGAALSKSLLKHLGTAKKESNAK